MFKIVAIFVLLCSLAQSSSLLLDPGSIDTSKSVGCASIYEFKYVNGSCLPTCPYPYIDLWHNQSYFCYHPCSGGYYNIWTEDCQETCQPEDVAIVDNILRCDVKIDSTSNTSCSNPTEFKYPNGSCLSDCPYPRSTEEDGGFYLCNPPCPGQYFNTSTQTCADTCENGIIKVKNDIAYCNKYSPLFPDGPCPNSNEWRYFNGSCSSSCPRPYHPMSYENHYCYPPCPYQSFYNTWDGGCLRDCEPEFIKWDSDFLTCEQPINSANGCPNAAPFRYLNDTCLPSCEYPFTNRWHMGFLRCVPDCPDDQYFHFWTDRCLSDCDTEYIREQDFIVYCYQPLESNNSTGTELYSATIEIYLRYDIPLQDFNAGGYLEKFITMIAKLLDVSDSDVKILSVREGSTIIESEVSLKSEPLANSESKANALHQKLTEAAESKGLNLEGIGVLNHKFSVVIPEQEESTAGINNDDDAADKSSSKGLALGLGVGLGVVAVGSVTLLIYSQYQKKQKLLKVREQIRGKVKTVAETPVRRDEEICSFVVHNSVEREAENISPRPGTKALKVTGADLESPELCKKEGEKDIIEEIQIENQGALSIDEIMKNIDEHSNQ